MEYTIKEKRSVLSVIIRILISLLIIFAYYWFCLPPINLRSPEFWFFVGFAIVVFVAVNAFSQIISVFKSISSGEGIKSPKDSFKSFSKPILGAIISVVSIALIGFIASCAGSEIFNAGSYNQLLTLNNSSFSADVSEISQSQIPVVDRDSAERLGQRKLGEMSDLVSQFEVGENYTQINYKGKPTRVTPLVYSDYIKWFLNQSEGIPAYLNVDMATQETSLVRLKQGIKYSESELFLRNINRYLRFKYPTTIFDNISFEIDENGTPFWVASTVTYRIGLWSGKDIDGAVLVNAITGESQQYALKDVPAWVDQVFDSDMIIEQLGFNGKYRSGFFNSIFGQKGVLVPTDGYNYLAIDDDVWLYTGMTSAVSDESNVGFVLINLRTKEGRYYNVPGAEEYSAMGSAEGQVQNLGYTSTFPILLNVSNRPTYFMSLKDDAGLVKMYAFVDVAQYQIVGTGNTVNQAKENYISKLGDENLADENVKKTETKVSGTIALVNSAVVGGNTKYYIMLEDNDNVYTVDISLSDKLPFAKAGQKIELTITEQNGKSSITKIDFIVSDSLKSTEKVTTVNQ